MRRNAATILCVLLACSARTAPTSGQSDDKAPPMTPLQPPPSKPKTTLEQVERAYPRARVHRSDISVPGIELFVVSTDREVPQDAENLPELVAIAGGVGAPILTGREVTRAVARATRDAMTLARVAMAAERQGGELLMAPKNEEQKQANVGPPTIEDHTLTFWIWTSGVGRMLDLAKVDLTTGILMKPGRPVPLDERITKAIEALFGTSLSMQDRALETLTQHCANARARTALFEALAKAPKDELRMRVAMAVEACGASAVEPLIKALETDNSPIVRATAARVLGRLRDVRARPALEKASRDRDASLASAASDALRALP